MNLTKTHLIFTIFGITFATIPASSIAAPGTLGLSTSGLVRLNLTSTPQTDLNSCSGKNLRAGRSYISLSIIKITVNKSESRIDSLLNKDQKVFPSASLKAIYAARNISITKIGNPMKISGGSNSIDMGVTWEILDRLPWNIKDATLETRVSYSANSTIDATITALSSITSAIPTYSLTTSALTGFAIASSIDSLLFTQNRSVEILRFSHDLPLTASSLCEGFYATFSAKDNAIYEKYYGKTSWNGNDIEYEGKSINDASYAIFSIKVFDRYYPDKDAPFNSEKNWAEKYSQSFIEASGLSYAISQDSIKEIEKNTVQLLNDAKVLLLGDADINSEEKIEIHNTAQRKIRDLIKSAQTRLTSVDSITLAGTTSAITSIINTPSDIKGMNDAKVNAKRALDELASKNPSANKDTGKALRETINTIEKSLR